MTPLELLRQYFGYESFRTGQEAVINSILNRRDALCIMPTGSGKSICYQLPALLQNGLTLVISPLISLMKDQVEALNQQGIRAACLNSSLSQQDFADTLFDAASGVYRILYVAPERLLTPSFLNFSHEVEISFVAVDEAHCVSQWGQDFRPAYLRIPEYLNQLEKRPVVLACTATATAMVSDDIQRLLQLQHPLRVITGFDRPNLSYSVLLPKDKTATLIRLLTEREEESGIVYCGTRKNVEEICSALQGAGFTATRYHAGLSHEERLKNQDDFLYDRCRVMVATNAFGMGIDKSNVSYVIHYNMPQSLEAYYQEAGRAGRDGCDADCILLYAPQDVKLAEWMIENSEPNPLLTQEEQESIREKDRERLKRMTFYARSRRCLRANILHYFGETAPERCGNCSVCCGTVRHADITQDAKKILSCVARCGQQYSRKVICDLLRGIRPFTSDDSVDLTRLSTFGIMEETPEADLMDEMEELIRQGVLSEKTDGDYRAVILTEKSREVLFEGRRIMMRKDRDDSGSPGRESVLPVSGDLMNALKYLRLMLSSEEHVAAFVIFSDATLQDICRKMPKNMIELQQVSGIGTYKANRYGRRVLEVVDHYRKGKPVRAGRRK